MAINVSLLWILDYHIFCRNNSLIPLQPAAALPTTYDAIQQNSPLRSVTLSMILHSLHLGLCFFARRREKKNCCYCIILISFNQALSTKNQDHSSVILIDSHFTLKNIPLDGLRLCRETLVVWSCIVISQVAPFFFFVCTL